MGKVCSIIFFLILSLTAFSQPYNSYHNKFTVSEKKGCAGFSTQVNYTGCGSGGIFCVIDYGDGRTAQPFVDGDIANYPTAGSFELKIYYSTITANKDTIRIDVIPSNPPAFDAYLCNNQVMVKVMEKNYPFYTINYNDATAAVTLPANSATDIHPYAAGPHSISVRGYNGANTVDNCAVANQPITVGPLTATTINQVEVMDASSVKVDFAAATGVQYRFMIGTNTSGSFQFYNTVFNPPGATQTVPGIRPDDNFYCFRMDTYNPCTSTTVANSNIVCSINADAVAQPDQNQVTWVTAPASGTHLLSGFDVVKNGTTLTPALPASQSTFTDPAIVCNTTYQYQIVGNYSGGARSLSLPKSVTAISSGPPALLNISSIVDDPGVALSWIPDPAYPVKEYQIIKSINGAYSPLTTTTEPSYTDAEYVTTENSCYRISYTDMCDNPSPASLDACPIQLTGGLQADNVINLNWTDYVGWTNGVSSYTLEKYNEQGTLLSSTDVGTGTTYTDATPDFINQVYEYRIVATANEAGVTLSASNWFEVIKEPNLFYPTAFTPNNDGLNDTFNVYGQYIAKFEMKIFNRWGEMMFMTDDLGTNGWDGTFRGNLMPEGTYVFTAQITDLAQRTFDRSGSVLLLRKK